MSDNEALLLKCIKDLQRITEILENRIEDLERQVIELSRKP